MIPLAAPKAGRWHDDEREAGRLWSMHPVDVQWSIVKERAKARGRERANDRQRRRRGRLKALRTLSADLDVREESAPGLRGPRARASAWPALAEPGRPGVRKIAARFGVDPGTVQRISRPFGGASAAAA